jgi:hypothetical protein
MDHDSNYDNRKDGQRDNNRAFHSHTEIIQHFHIAPFQIKVRPSSKYGVGFAPAFSNKKSKTGKMGATSLGGDKNRFAYEVRSRKGELNLLLDRD